MRKETINWLMDIGIIQLVISLLVQIFQSSAFIAGFENVSYQMVSIGFMSSGLLCVIVGWVSSRRLSQN